MPRPPERRDRQPAAALIPERRDRRTATALIPEHRGREHEIRDKARDLFIRHGYRKTTIEDIGRACGLGKAALYHYFPGKEAILAEVVRFEGEKVLAKVRAAVRAETDPRAQLVTMVKTGFEAVSRVLDEIVENRNAKALRATLPLAASSLERFLDEEVEILRSILAAGARKGIFKKVASPSVPLLIILGLRGVQLHLLDVPGPPRLEEAVDTLLELFLEGLCT